MGTHLHFQGYLELEKKQRIPWLQSNVSHTCKKMARKGSAEQNRHYCSKPHQDCACEHCVEEAKHPTVIPGTFIELGKISRINKKSHKEPEYKLAMTRVLAGVNPNTRAFAEEFPSTWLRYRRDLNELLTLDKKRDLSVPIYVEVHYGVTGGGKTETIKTSYQRGMDETYIKSKDSGNNVWWPGYKGEDVVIMNEFSGQWFTPDYLCLLWDSNPLHVEAKNQSINMLATKFIVSTNRDPRLWYEASKRDPTTITRRITKLIVYPTAALTWDKGEMSWPLGGAPRETTFDALPVGLYDSKKAVQEEVRDSGLVEYDLNCRTEADYRRAEEEHTVRISKKLFN